MADNAYVVFEHQAAAQAALNTQSHSICGVRVYVANYVKPQKNSSDMFQGPLDWAEQRNWVEQPTLRPVENGQQPGNGSLVSRRNYTRGSHNSNEASFEPVSHFERQHIQNKFEIESRENLCFEKASKVKLASSSQSKLHEYDFISSNLRSSPDQRIRQDPDKCELQQKSSEKASNPRGQASVITFHSFQHQHFSLGELEVHEAEAVNLKNGPPSLQNYCNMQEIENRTTEIDPNLRLNLENNIAFLRRTCRWPATLHH